MRQSRLLLLAATACLAVTSRGAALAQQAPAASAPSEVGEVVITGSQVKLPSAFTGGQVARGGRVGLLGDLSLMDTPFSTTSYTETLIRDQQARGVADVLQNDPSVRIATGFGNFQELYVLRGFPIYSDDMTYDGVYGVLPRQFVAAEFLERVEILRGANAFLNGAAPGGSAVGGAVNLVPKRAPDDPLNRFTVGLDNGGTFYGAADIARRFGPQDSWGLRVNLVRRDGDTPIDGQSINLTAASAGLDYRGDKLRFSADAGWQDHRLDAPRPSVTPTGAAPPPPDASANFAQPWTYTSEQQLFGALRGEYDILPGLSAWAAAGGRSGHEQNDLANPTSDPSGDTSAYRFINRREDHVFSADAGVRDETQLGPVDNRLVVSGSFSELQSRNAYAFSNFAGFSGNLYAPTVVAPPDPDFYVGGTFSAPHVTERTRNDSGAIADTLSVLNGAVQLTGGLRLQEIYTASYDYNSGGLLSAFDGHALTPAVALVVKPLADVSLYANYAEALQPGQVAPAVSGSTPITNAGQVLAPFRSRQYETGAKYENNGWGGSVSLFSITQQQAIVAGGVFGADGEQRNRGVELNLFGEPLTGVRVITGMSFIDPRLVHTQGGALDGTQAIGVPRLQGNVNIEWDVPYVPGVTLEARDVYTGTQFIDAANANKLPDWNRVDLGVRYRLETGGKPVTLRVRVENVADSSYWASAGGYPGADYLVLGEPRTASFSASVDF